MINTLLVVAGGELIVPQDLPKLDSFSSFPRGAATQPTAGLSLEERERQAIFDALKQCDGHREQAADLLGISVRTLYNRLKQYGIR